MTTVHHCPSAGRTAPGDEFDCDACRASLLEAFRPPHVIVPDGPPFSRTVPLDPNPEPDPDHDVDGGVQREVGGGGFWWVRCTCGWQRGARFVRPTGYSSAQRLVTLWISRHQADPDEREFPA